MGICLGEDCHFYLIYLHFTYFLPEYFTLFFIRFLSIFCSIYSQVPYCFLLCFKMVSFFKLHFSTSVLLVYRMLCIWGQLTKHSIIIILSNSLWESLGCFVYSRTVCVDNFIFSFPAYITFIYTLYLIKLVGPSVK